jgi:hypothetical protein
VKSAKLFVSFWNICLENLPDGTFVRRQLTPSAAKRAMMQARRNKSLLCVTQDDLLAPYCKRQRGWNGIRCKVGALSPNGVLILFWDTCKEVPWFLQDEALELFPPKNPKWGDIFLSADRVKRFKADPRDDLTRLHKRLGAANV